MIDTAPAKEDARGGKRRGESQKGLGALDQTKGKKKRKVIPWGRYHEGYKRGKAGGN